MTTTRRDHLLPALTLVGLLAVSGCSAVAAAPDPAPESAPHWSYEDEDGPIHWSELTDDFSACSAGSSQSPIDLPAVVPTASEQITVEFGGDASGTVADTGHTMQFTAAAGPSSVTTGDERYELLQMHVHTPSEHTIDGVPAAAEFHFVHADSDGELLVVGVLARDGAASASWQPVVDTFASGAEADLTADIATLMPQNLSYYGYEGSLTTPPCSEDVEWVVLSTPIELSSGQLDALATVHDHNARPVQPLGDRTVIGGSGASIAD